MPAEAFSLLRGEDALRSYRFGSGTIDHRFCARCGVKVFGTVQLDGAAFVAVSVPCLDLAPRALAALPVRPEDGLHETQKRAARIPVT